MACGKTLIHCFTILAILNSISGQEGSGHEPQHPGHQHSGHQHSGRDKSDHPHAGPPNSGPPQFGPQNSEHWQQSEPQPNEGSQNNDASMERASMSFPGFPGGFGGFGSFPFASMFGSGGRLSAISGDSESQMPTNEDASQERASMSFPGFPGGLGSFGSFPFASMFGLGSGGSSSGSTGESGSQMPNPASLFSNFASMFGPRQAYAEPGSESFESYHASENGDTDEHAEHQDRFFFSALSSRITSCNYTAQPGSRCLSCRQAINCRSNNIGIVRTCRFLQPYCNNGRCSIIPGTACTSTSAAAVAATTVAATTAAATTVAGG